MNKEKVATIELPASILGAKVRITARLDGGLDVDIGGGLYTVTAGKGVVMRSLQFTGRCGDEPNTPCFVEVPE